MKNVISWILQLAVAGLFFYAAWPKFVAAPDTVTTFGNLGMGSFGRVLIGILEASAALALLWPRSAAWGALLAWGVMTGALIAHATQLGFLGVGGSMGFLALGLWLASLVILILRRQQIPLVRSMFEINESAPDKP